MKHVNVGLADELWEAFKNVYSHKNETKLEHDQEAEYEARDIMCDAIKAYVLGADLNEEPRTHRSTRDVVREAYAIAESVPGMMVEELKDGWIVEISGIYEREAKGVEQLLKAVKEGKALNDLLREIKAEKEYKAIRLEDEDEEDIQDTCHESETIRIEGLEPGTKDLLLHFIEHLTIKEISEILENDDYPHLIWDELYYIREKLKRSIENYRSPQ